MEPLNVLRSSHNSRIAATNGVYQVFCNAFELDALSLTSSL
jgi:hypothetical protein